MKAETQKATARSVGLLAESLDYMKTLYEVGSVKLKIDKRFKCVMPKKPKLVLNTWPKKFRKIKIVENFK